MALVRGLAILAVLFPAAAMAQRAVYGTVRDPMEKPISYANVFVEQQGRLLRLTQSDDQGSFRLEPLDTGSYRLSVTSIGYKKHTQNLRLGLNPVGVDVVLLPDTVMLDQVIVHDDGPIRLKGDTLVYDATYFRTGEEVVLADLLKKLPGITVDNDGKVKFKGKEVVKVKVEDDDLFENNYQLLTRNLSADLVEQVDVLQNYSDNRLLKNIEDSEDVALNVTLKKDRKRQLFGEARLETNAQRYEGRLNLMSLEKKLKIYLFSTGNNTGSDPAGEAAELLQFGSRQEGTIAKAEYLVPMAKPNLPGFKKERYYFNDVFLGSLNTVFKPARNLKVSLMGLGYRDETAFSMASRSDYFTTLDTVTYQEFAASTYRDLFGYLVAQIDYDASPKSTVRYRGRYDTHQGSVPERNLLNLNEVNVGLSSRTFHQDHFLNVTRKITDRSVLTLDLRWVSDQRPQDMMVDGNLFAGYFSTPTSDTLRQTSDFSSQYWSGTLNWYARSTRGKMGVKAGLDHFNQQVSTDLRSDPSALSGNRLDNSQRKSWLEGYYAFSFGNLVLTLGVSLQYLSNSLSDRDSNDPLFINPRLGVQWRFSERSRLSAVYLAAQSTSSISQLTRSPIMINFNQLAINDDGFRTFASRTLLVTYELGGWSSGFSLFANLYHRETPSDYLTNTEIEPNYLVGTSNQLADREMSSLSVTIDQFIKPLKSNLKFIYNGSRASFVTSTESVAVPTISATHTFDGSFRTAFRGPVNAHGGVNVLTSSTASGLIDASNLNLMIYLDGYLNSLNRRLNCTVHGELYKMASVPGRPVFYFVDFNVRWQAKEGKGLALLVKARNLLDERVFVQRYVSNQSIAATTNRLIPRYVMAGIEFRF